VVENPYIEIIKAAWQAARRRLAGELFSMPLYRTLVVRFAQTTAPRTDLPYLPGGNPKKGEALAQGNFFLAGVTLYFDDAKALWNKPVPSRRFAVCLHEFGWIHDVLALDTEATIALAKAHVNHWITVYGVWNPFSWAPGLAARRCLNWLSYGQILLGDDEDGNTRRECLIRQVSYLHGLSDIASETRDRLQIALALIATGALIPGAERFLDRGLSLLAVQLAEQILPDGGHISRNPEMATTTLCDLVALKQMLEQQDITVPEELERALARLAPMVRFLCAADGHLSVFNGGGEGRALTTNRILHDLAIPESAFSYAPHSGYQRVKTPASVFIMDTGRAPPSQYSQHAHAGALAFEFSTPGGRLIVNCGWSEDQPDPWHLAVRTSAAHSTLTVNDTSSAQIYSAGIRTALLGPRLRQRGVANPSRRKLLPGKGTRLEASHAGYLSRYGLIHQRQVLVSEDGMKVSGEDMVFRPRSAPKLQGDQMLPSALRFHLHPKVRASLSRDGTQVLLVLPDGSGWRFYCEEHGIELQPSVYLAGGAPPQRTSQLVVQHTMDGQAEITDTQNRICWSIERIRT
jgi:uncharacterized heparinase superfamily protein